MKTEKIILPPDAWNMISGVRLVENRYENRPALVFSGEAPECVLETDVRSVPGRYFRIEADIAADPQGSGTCDVYRIRLSQPGRQDERDFVPVPFRVEPFRTIVPEPFFEAEPSLPLKIRLERVNRDPRNSCRAETGVLSVRLVPMDAPTRNLTVSSVPGYNSWPFIQNLNGCLCCVYSRGTCHHFGEIRRGVFARTTADGGKSWGPEYTVVNTPEGADSAIGKGLDSTGAMLIWVRHVGEEWRHELYRTADGIHSERIAQLRPDPMPMQITDIISVPGVGLMSLWFAGNYREGETHSWGTLISRDDGRHWEQRVVESGLSKSDWPTEPSAVYLGDGKIFAIARVEGRADDTTRALAQLESGDYGKTWKRTRTNITDVVESTPSLLFDRGKFYLYYYQRGAGQLKCRIADPASVMADPLRWPVPEVAALGSREWHHAGNVNALSFGNTHCLAFYSGDEKVTDVVLKIVPR